MTSVVCINIVCTQGDKPEQREWLANWLKERLERANANGSLIDVWFEMFGDESCIANTAISITTEER